MTRCAIRGGWALPALAVLLFCQIGGCGKKDQPTSADGKASPPPAPAAAAPAGNARLNQSFSEATLKDPPPDADEILPEVTMSGKSVGKLYEATVAAWDQVPFVTADGKHWTYVATIDTDLGAIEITLLPEVAPNHVRSFVALARVGYYDGLVFERIVHQKSEAEPSSVVDLIEGGCPVGTGNPGFGSIGYWLKAEFSEQLKHEEGVVGACLGQGADTASCRFYVALSKAPALDGERTLFGRVTRGIDVVRRIASQPISNSPEFPDGTHPDHPTLIRKVTIQMKETVAEDKKP